jgi:hypothetical protein
MPEKKNPKDIKENGFSAFYKIVISNQDKHFELTLPEGEILEVAYDMDFDDDSGSQADEYLEPFEYKTISFTVVKVIKDEKKRYKEGHVVLVSKLDMPTSYKVA